MSMRFRTAQIVLRAADFALTQTHYAAAFTKTLDVYFRATLANATGTRYNTIYDPTYDVGAPFNVAHINPPRWFVASVTVRF